MRAAWPPIVVAIVLLAAWQVLSAATGSGAVSSPVETLVRLGKLMRSGRFWLDVGETGVAFLWALLLSMVFGVAIGVALGVARASGDVIEPILVGFLSLPKVTLYPLVLLGFGLGISAKVAFGVMHGLVPVALLTRTAILQLRPVYRRTARVLRLTRVEMIWRIVLPAIVPELVAGLRIGFSLSLLGVLIGEMFASKRGLGFAAMNAMGLGDIATIMAIGVFLAGFAIAANAAILSVEKVLRDRTKGKV